MVFIAAPPRFPPPTQKGQRSGTDHSPPAPSFIKSWSCPWVGGGAEQKLREAYPMRGLHAFSMKLYGEGDRMGMRLSNQLLT